MQWRCLLAAPAACQAGHTAPAGAAGLAAAAARPAWVGHLACWRPPLLLSLLLQRQQLLAATAGRRASDLGPAQGGPEERQETLSAGL